MGDIPFHKRIGNPTRREEYEILRSFISEEMKYNPKDVDFVFPRILIDGFKEGYVEGEAFDKFIERADPGNFQATMLYTIRFFSDHFSAAEYTKWFSYYQRKKAAPEGMEPITDEEMERLNEWLETRAGKYLKSKKFRPQPRHQE